MIKLHDFPLIRGTSLKFPNSSRCSKVAGNPVNAYKFGVAGLGGGGGGGLGGSSP